MCETIITDYITMSSNISFKIHPSDMLAQRSYLCFPLISPCLGFSTTILLLPEKPTQGQCCPRSDAEDAQPLGKKILDIESRRVELYVQKSFAIDDQQLIRFFRNISSFLSAV